MFNGSPVRLPPPVPCAAISGVLRLRFASLTALRMTVNGRAKRRTSFTDHGSEAYAFPMLPASCRWRAAALVFFCAVAHTTFAAETKRLVEFGWDEPGTAFMRAHIKEMERTPFDGCVFHVDSKRPEGGTGRFTWECWGTREFSEAELIGASDDLAEIAGSPFRHNFLRFNTTPAKLDWFDDYAAVVANARLAARLARAGRCPGILLDIEQYEGPLFNFGKQRDAKIKSWDAYAEQVRRRGREIMEAFQQSYPDVVVFLTFGYSLPWEESQAGKKPLAECSYGLLAPFLDGMVEAAEGRTRIVDGYELSYGFKDPARFGVAAQTMRHDLLPIVRDPPKYGRILSVGFGLWLDHQWRQLGWNAQEPAKNYFTPEALEASARAALDAADQYVWIYSETPRWWSAEGRTDKLPPAYDAALRAARQPRHP
jgi:hypothetical protein